jgi:hypothetical protein
MGSSGFKIFRLLSALALAIHIFACTFYKVVVDHRTPEDVQSLLEAKGAAPDVSTAAVLHTIIFVWKESESKKSLDVGFAAAAAQLTSAFGSGPKLPT